MNDNSDQVGGLTVPGEIRRVLLAEKPDGSSFVARDEMVAPAAFPGIGQIYTLWGTDSFVQLPDSGNVPEFEGTFPPAGGFRVFVTRFAPGGTKNAEGDDMPDHLNMPSANDMHSSDTVDFNIVLAGVVDCVMSDQSVVRLKAGDMIVLNGAEHCWLNNTDQEAIMMFFMTGAERA